MCIKNTITNKLLKRIIKGDNNLQQRFYEHATHTGGNIETSERKYLRRRRDYCTCF